MTAKPSSTPNNGKPTDLSLRQYYVAQMLGTALELLVKFGDSKENVSAVLYDSERMNILHQVNVLADEQIRMENNDS